MSKARAVRPELLTLLVSLAFLLFYNLPLWQRLLAITPGLAGPRHDAGGRPDDRRDLQPGADPAGVPLAAQAGADPADPGGRRYHLLHDPVRRADGRRHAAQRHADQPGRGRRPAFAEARRLPGVAWCAAGLAAVAHPGALPAVATRAAEQAAGGARLPGPARRGGAGQLPGAVLAVPQQQGTAPAGHPEQPGRRRHRLRQGQAQAASQPLRPIAVDARRAALWPMRASR